MRIHEWLKGFNEKICVGFALAFPKFSVEVRAIFLDTFLSTMVYADNYQISNAL